MAFANALAEVIVLQNASAYQLTNLPFHEASLEMALNFQRFCRKGVGRILPKAPLKLSIYAKREMSAGIALEYFLAA